MPFKCNLQRYNAAQTQATMAEEKLEMKRRFVAKIEGLQQDNKESIERLLEEFKVNLNKV